MLKYNKHEKFKLTSSGVYVNRTGLYIVPFLNCYGRELYTLLKIFKIKAFCIGDVISGILNDKILIVVEKDNAYYESTLRKITRLPYYDYHFSDHKNICVICLNLPREGITEKFVSGRYSKLCTLTEIEKHFNRSGITDVLLNTTEAKVKFQKAVYDEFGTTLEIKDIKESDFPPILDQEIYSLDFLKLNLPKI